MPRVNPQVEALEREVRLLREERHRLLRDPGECPVTGCGDNSCIVHTPTGMATNGGCRCEERELRRAVQWLKARNVYLMACMMLKEDPK